MALKDDLIKQYKDKLEAEAQAKEAARAARRQQDIQDIQDGLRGMYPEVVWDVTPIYCSNEYCVSGDDVMFFIEFTDLYDWLIGLGWSAAGKIVADVRKRPGSITVNKRQFDLALGQLFAEQEA